MRKLGQGTQPKNLMWNMVKNVVVICHMEASQMVEIPVLGIYGI